MADERKGVVAAGFSLLWRRQGVLWWMFVVNLVWADWERCRRPSTSATRWTTRWPDSS